MQIQNQKFNKSDLKLLNMIYSRIKKSPSKTVCITLDCISFELGKTDRQFRRIKNKISHIFHCEWYKAVTIDGIKRRKVYVFTQVGNIPSFMSDISDTSDSKSPISIIEDKDLNKNIDLRSESFSNLKKEKNKRPSVFDKQKTIAEMLPLIDHETCEELRSKSGRPFSDNFIIQLVLKISKKPTITATFKFFKGFIAYMAKVLQYEKHDAVKTSNVNFKFKDNIPVTNNEHQKQQKTSEPLELPDGIWGDVCKKLVDIHGQCVYKNWFSKLTPIINKENKTVELKAPNSFIQRWVEDNYSDAIKALAKILEFNFKGIRIQQYFDNVTLK